MAWEQRGNGRVYYSARRIGGRVVKTYVGSGPMAQMAARLDESGRLERDERRLEEVEQREAYEEAEAHARELDELIAGALDGLGLHRPKRGRWRRRRRRLAP